MPRTPLIVLLAGPNGAGKSTSAARLLRGALEVEEFVNADTIAQGLSAYRPEGAAIAAGRVMLDRLHTLAAERRDFAFETTLSGRAYLPWLQSCREAGYRVHLIFLSLPTSELAIARVALRVSKGGHNVPDDTVRRRFRNGLTNFFGAYLDAVDSWELIDNHDLNGPQIIARRVNSDVVVIEDLKAWQRLKEVT